MKIILLEDVFREFGCVNGMPIDHTLWAMAEEIIRLRARLAIAKEALSISRLGEKE